MIFANTKIREDVHLQLGYHKQLISKDYVELFCGFYIFIILTSHACQHNSRGKLCCRHRFGGQMIAQMNLFRGQMIDHRKRFDGEMIALMTAKLFPMIDHRNAKLIQMSDHLPANKFR